jgi:hypothetical protein
MSNDEIKIISLFAEKCNELRESNFTKNMVNSGVTVSAKKGEPVVTKRIGPDYENIKSFVITIRNFMLDSDSISVRNIAKIYEKLEDTDNLKIKFVNAKIALNNFLDSNSTFIINEKRITNRILINNYIYGDVIHLEKHDEFKKWIDGNLMRDMIYNEIVYVLGNFANFLYFIDSVNQEHLKNIK